MIKLKILLVIALYIILGAIGYFNFGFHNLMVEKAGGKSRPNGSAWKRLETNLKNIQAEVPQESRDSFSDQEVDNNDNQ
jgi:hypothetical protein